MKNEPFFGGLGTTAHTPALVAPPVPLVVSQLSSCSHAVVMGKVMGRR